MKIGKYILLILILLGFLIPGLAQEKTDSLVLNVGKSKIIFLIRDQEDLKKLQQYDLNEILDQLSFKLTGDSTLLDNDGNEVDDTVIVDERRIDDKQVIRDKDNDEDDGYERRRRYRRGTHHAFNFDLGTNNFVDENGAFPDESNALYTVRPWGSWYFAINSIYETQIAGPLYLQWGGGVSWYNFKFENDRTQVIDGQDQVIFIENISLPDADFQKSKLTAVYAQVSFVPMISLDRTIRRDDSAPWKKKWWDDDGDHRGFRFGLGGYGAYRIDSYTKAVYKENGDKKKDRNHENFHLQNFRYGIRAQVGFKGTDLFFNYDLNELFNEGNGPRLNAFSFGITF